MNYLFAISTVLFVAVVSLTMMWKLGRLKFLGSEIKLSPTAPPRTRADVIRPYSPKKLQGLTLLIWGMLTFELAYAISKYLFLCYLYGFSRVRDERLHFSAMGNGHPWVVSNGDQVSANLHSVLFVFCVVTWIVPAFLGFVVILRFLPEQKAIIPSALAQAYKNIERRPLFEKGRPMRRLGLIFLLLWILTISILAVFARWIGRMDLVFIPCVTIIIYLIFHYISKRHFLLMIATTPCPQCGLKPMRYAVIREKDGNCNLLICDRCHIGWNLGPI
jgi:hypothetical protein